MHMCSSENRIDRIHNRALLFLMDNETRIRKDQLQGPHSFLLFNQEKHGCCQSTFYLQLHAFLEIWCSAASLGLVSPGAATDGCHPISSWKIWRPFFSHRLWPFLAVVCSPLQFSHVVHPVFFLNSATKNNFRSGITSLEVVTLGGPPLALMTPLMMSLEL